MLTKERSVADLQNVLRTAIKAQAALWDALQEIERLVGEREVPGLGRLVEQIAVTSEGGVTRDDLTALMDLVSPHSRPFGFQSPAPERIH